MSSQLAPPLTVCRTCGRGQPRHRAIGPRPQHRQRDARHRWDPPKTAPPCRRSAESMERRAGAFGNRDPAVLRALVNRASRPVANAVTPRCLAAHCASSDQSPDSPPAAMPASRPAATPARYSRNLNLRSAVSRGQRPQPQRRKIGQALVQSAPRLAAVQRPEYAGRGRRGQFVRIARRNRQVAHAVPDDRTALIPGEVVPTRARRSASGTRTPRTHTASISGR